MTNRPKVYLTASGVWLLFLVVAFSTGAVRELVVRPIVGEHAARILGTLAVVAVLLGIMVVVIRRIRDRCAPRDLWLIGLLWLVMTASFELLFFHVVAGKPWVELLADYNVLRGRIWVLVLLTMLLGPAAIHAILERRAGDGNAQN